MKRRNQLAVAFAVLLLAACGADERSVPETGYRDWRVYGGGWDNIRYSTLDQINEKNVHQLEVAWTYDSGDAFKGSEMQCNPIVIGDTLYGTTPKMRLVALDAATGKPRWVFDPSKADQSVGLARIRGVAHWAEGADARVFLTAHHNLYAIDARSGKPIASFGNQGRVDLREGLGRDPKLVSLYVNVPGVVYGDLLILGSVTSESLPAAPGDIRAYDVRTGEPRWSFHTIPHPGEYGYDTWPKDAWKYSGGANDWSGMSLDAGRGIVFASTGSASFDFYGGDRVGDNLFANCVLALNAATGERLWHFQVVKHDLWDRDLPAPPNLVTVLRDGKLIDAVAQVTKSGHIFVFDRDTGEPLFPIEYRQVPASDVPGEVTAETQAFPLKPPPIARQLFTEDMVTKRTPEAHRAVLDRLRRVRNGGPFDPPSLQGTIMFPGIDGGPGWGGAAFDPETGFFYVNSNEMAWILRLTKLERGDQQRTGRTLYLRYCANCHRQDRTGAPPEYPSLVGVENRLTPTEIYTVVAVGQGRMPGFPTLGWDELPALVRYASTGEDTVLDEQEGGPSSEQVRMPYFHDGYNRFLDPDGYPAVEPPWGTLNAINLDTGEITWRVPLGEYPELVRQGVRNTGTENYGGPVVTAGGLIFIGATGPDRKFRAFDKMTGELLWETTLPAGGNATPSVYELDGRQFVVIACGGGKTGAPSGSSYVAFALPR